MKGTLLTALCALTAVSAYGQAQVSSPATSACTLKIAQAPAVRGVKLGMKVDEVLAMFPGSADKDGVKPATGNVDGYPNFGVASAYINPSEYSTKDRFTGIADYRFSFLDGRVIQYEVEYRSLPEGPTWRNVNDFVAKVADSLKLPPAGSWDTDPNIPYRRKLRCEGFQVDASNLNLRGSLTVSTPDLPYEKQRERQTALDEKLRREFKP